MQRILDEINNDPSGFFPPDYELDVEGSPTVTRDLFGQLPSLMKRRIERQGNAVLRYNSGYGSDDQWSFENDPTEEQCSFVSTCSEEEDFHLQDFDITSPLGFNEGDLAVQPCRGILVAMRNATPGGSCRDRGVRLVLLPTGTLLTRGLL